jgi:hypothetical protein
MSGYTAQKNELSPEPLGLPSCHPNEMRPLDPLRESEEVLDHRRVPRLTAWNIALEHDRRESVGGGVHRSSQAGWAGTDDGYVVLGAGGRSESAPCPDQRLSGGGFEDAIAVDEHRQPRLDDAMARQQIQGLGRVGLVELIRLGGPREEVAQAVIPRI